MLDSAGIDIDYVVVTDTHLGTAPTSGDARLLMAVTIDGTRLIDNAAIDIGAAR